MTAVGPWTISADEHAWFTALSGDANPIHADPVAARRLLGGRMLVHGAHLLLRALDQAAVAGAWTSAPARVSVVFRNGVAPGDPLVTHVESEAARTAITVVDAARVHRTVATITVEHAGPRTAVPFDPAPAPAGRDDVARPLTLDDLGALVGVPQAPFRPPVDPSVCAARLPAVTAVLGAGRVSEIAAISHVVGMRSPGRWSMSSAYDIDVTEPQGATPSIAHVVEHVDPRLRRVRLVVSGASIAATVTAFSPPPPVDQRAVLRGGAGPGDDEFAGWRVLVTGGSRGAGEAAVRLLVAGGADVRFTWCAGADEARALADELGIAAVRWCAPGDGTGELAAALAGWSPTHVCWFASPSDEVEPAATEVEVDAFEGAVAVLCDHPPAAVLWPSTDLLDLPDDELPPGSAERVARARAGEAACARLAAAHPQTTVRAVRFPVLLTDRTQSLLPREYADTASTLLAALRTLPAGT